MAMVIGSADLGTGLAGAIFTQLKTLPGAQASGTGSPMAGFANALATAIVQYVQANATAHIANTLAGLQTSTAIGAPTGAPAAPADIPIT